MRRRWRALGVLVILAGPIAGSAQAQRRPSPPAPGGTPPGQWPMTGRDYALSRYSPLDQITSENIGRLRPVWTFSTGVLGAHEGNPLVVGSMLYVHSPFPNSVYALDLAQPGAPVKWRYSGPLPATKTATPVATCCDGGSRGLAYHPSGKLFVPLLTGELAALDAATGREIWRVRNADPRTGATLSGSPIVVQDLVIVGLSGAEYGVRGYVTAYDALSGRLVWRGWSTGSDAEVLLNGPANLAYPSHQARDQGLTSWPADAWQKGGGTTSGWISYDPALNLIYLGTDQPAPGSPAQRTGDNRWTSSLFAREATTGRVRWVLQITPHDQWGYGAANENILADLTIRGAPVKALVHFDRNGFAYTLDRETGKILLAEKYGPANWARTVDQTSGAPQLDPRFSAPALDAAAGTVPAARRPPATTAGICPASIGSKNLQPAAFSPLTALFYVPINNVCMDLSVSPGTYVAGRPYGPSAVKMTAGPGGNRGRFIAWDATTATIAWEIKELFPVTGGALTTGGGLVFYGTLDGWLKAVDQRTGRELWRFKTPSGIVGNPIAFEGPDGREFIAVLSGIGPWWSSGANGAAPDLSSGTNPGGVLLVFGL